MAVKWHVSAMHDALYSSALCFYHNPRLQPTLDLDLHKIILPRPNKDSLSSVTHFTNYYKLLPDIFLFDLNFNIKVTSYFSIGVLFSILIKSSLIVLNWVSMKKIVTYDIILLFEGIDKSKIIIILLPFKKMM